MQIMSRRSELLLLAIVVGLAVCVCVPVVREMSAPPAIHNRGGPAPALKPRHEFVSHAQFGEKWPLTVESGEIEARTDGAILFHADGKTYGVNGSAIDLGHQPIDQIWRDNPEVPGLKIDISPLLDVGFRLRK